MTTPQLKCPRPGRRGRLRIPSAPWTRDRGGGRLRQHPLSGPPPSLRPVPRHPSPPLPHSLTTTPPPSGEATKAPHIHTHQGTTGGRDLNCLVCARTSVCLCGVRSIGRPARHLPFSPSARGPYLIVINIIALLPMGTATNAAATAVPPSALGHDGILASSWEVSAC